MALMLPVVVQSSPMSFERMEQAVQWHKYRTANPGLVWLRRALASAAGRMG
jgi:LysR family nod box-dependent transcriptional activator